MAWTDLAEGSNSAIDELRDLSLHVCEMEIKTEPTSQGSWEK